VYLCVSCAVLAAAWRAARQLSGAGSNGGEASPAPVDIKGTPLAVNSRVKILGPNNTGVAAEAVVKVVGDGALLFSDKQYKVGG